MTKKITNAIGCIASLLNRKMKVLVVAGALVTGGLQAQTTVTINYGDVGQTLGVGTWTCPADVTSMTVECWGGGGAGGTALSIPNATSSSYRANVIGGGGAGGSYAAVTIPNPTAGDYTYTVGKGANYVAIGTAPDYFPNLAVSNGANTIFNNLLSETIVKAVGGAGGESAKSDLATGTFGLGGAKVATGNIGTTSAYGGAGAAAIVDKSGGGGGSAGAGNGPTFDGGDAINEVGGVAGTNGGVVGAAGNTGGAGQAGGITGVAPGAGGSGARTRATLSTALTSRFGGNGGNGRILITYTSLSTGLYDVNINAFVTVNGKNLLLNGDVNAVEVYDAQGRRLVSQGKVTSVNGLNNGIYIVKMHTLQGVNVQKVSIR